MKNNFDLEITKKFNENVVIEYGIIKGNNIVILIKAGQNGSYIGYENKYLNMAIRLNNKYGCTVVTSSNPFDGSNPIDNAIEVIEEIVEDTNNYQIYYLGFSNGGTIGLQFATYYSKIKKIISVNAPLMINYHKIKKGILDFNEQKIVLIYGDRDQSFRYTPLLDGISKENMEVVILKNEDHYISNNLEDFYSIPEKYFFY